MRNRLVLLLVLATLLGTPVLIHWQSNQQRCADIADTAICRIAVPDPLWVRPLGVLAAATLLVAGILYLRAFAARRKEKELLDDVGVHVPEQDLPLDE